MMHSVPLGLTGSAISGLAEVIRDLGPGPLPAADRACRRGNVEHSPVAKDTARRIGIVDDEREALRARRRLVPVQRRRLVGSVAGVLRRDRLTILEGIAR